MCFYNTIKELIEIINSSWAFIQASKFDLIRTLNYELNALSIDIIVC